MSLGDLLINIYKMEWKFYDLRVLWEIEVCWFFCWDVFADPLKQVNKNKL